MSYHQLSPSPLMKKMNRGKILTQIIIIIDFIIRTFTIRVADDEHFHLLASGGSKWLMLGLPEFDSVGKVIMGSVWQAAHCQERSFDRSKQLNIEAFST